MTVEKELATPENFDEERYLLANPDVARHVAAGGNALAHFRRHGLAEGRKQLVLDPTEAARRRRERYVRLAHLLDASAGAGGNFRFLEESDAFPVLYGAAPHRIEDYEDESANMGFTPFVEEVRAHPDRLYLDVGCGRRPAILPNCLYLEVYRSRSADIVMEPACVYPIASGSLDGVGCFAVLEHVARPWEVASEFHRILKPGGKIFIDWPFLQPVHGYPSHYYNATREGLRAMFAEGFEPLLLDTLTNQRADHTFSWLLRTLMEGIGDDALRDEVMAMPVGALVAEPAGSPFWQHVLASLPPSVIETLACGNTLIAVKR